MEIFNTVVGILKDSGLVALFTADGWKNGVMILVACGLLFLAIHPKFQFEPLLLLPIAFGMLLANLPHAGMYHSEIWAIPEVTGGVAEAFDYWTFDGSSFHIIAGNVLRDGGIPGFSYGGGVYIVGIGGYPRVVHGTSP